MRQARAGLEVIGAGFGRSGTKSLQRALEMLGYAPCYHMQSALPRPWHVRAWLAASRGERVDFVRLFRGWRATVDWPACEYWRELTAAFPEARVILNLREPQAWYDSVRTTLWPARQAYPWWAPRLYARMLDGVIWQGRFGGRFEDRAAALAAYAAHVAEVRRHVPPERLLVYDVGQGWEPLCRFLGRPVPVAGFPRLNDRRTFARYVAALRLLRWLPLAALVLAALLAWHSTLA